MVVDMNNTFNDFTFFEVFGSNVKAALKVTSKMYSNTISRKKFRKHMDLYFSITQDISYGSKIMSNLKNACKIILYT